MTDAIASCDWSKVELLVPYLYMTKGEIVKVGLSLGVDYSDTWTCYKGGDKACGKCGSCIERLEAFAFANAVDPIEYETTEEETTEEESE
jgi:7-cyano-7-deazaguanine synthase